MYYLTVGYPIGTKVEDNRQIFQVSLRGELKKLTPIEFRVWKMFLLGGYKEEIQKNMPGVAEDLFFNTVMKLVLQGLLEELNDSDFKDLGKLKFMRQGIGLGFNFDDNEYYVLFRNELPISKLEYEVWSLMDGSMPFSEIEKNVMVQEKASNLLVRAACLKLCNKGLTLALNRNE